MEIGEAGEPTAHWHAPDGHMVTGYSLDAGGNRTAFVNIEDDDPAQVRGWPTAA